MPATKTFTAQLAAVALVAEALGPVPWTGADWERLPEAWSRTAGRSRRPPTRAAESARGRRRADCRGPRLPDVRGARGRAQAARGRGRAGRGLVGRRLPPRPGHGGPRRLPLLAVSAAGPAAADVEELAGELEGAGTRVLRLADRPGADLPYPGGLAEPLLRAAGGGARPAAGAGAGAAARARPGRAAGAAQGHRDELGRPAAPLSRTPRTPPPASAPGAAPRPAR